MRYCQKSAAEIGLCAKSAGADAPELASQIQAGQAEFFTLDGCAYITRAEITTRGREFVVCCAEGKNLRSTIRKIISIVTEQGFEFIRYHTATAAAGRAMARMAGVTAWSVTEPDGTTYFLTDLRGQHGR